MYAEALVSLTYMIVAYQDFRERMVSDWVWIPAIVSLPIFLWESHSLWWLSAIKLGIIGAAALASLLLGIFGQADSVALLFMGVGTGFLSPLPQLVGMSVAALAHISYLVVKSGSFKIERVMSLEEAEKQNVWIPRKVEVDGRSVELKGSPEEVWGALKEYEGKNAKVRGSYGVPLAGYMAIGYIAAFLAMLFQYL